MSQSQSAATPVAERSLIIATAGHVDHGKTSLITHITGVDTDTLPEEKARGLSINLGYAYLHFDTEKGGAVTTNTIGFVDVPGHTDFINNMLAGVGAVDAALLVVAADDGIMPQTREHVAILQLLGVSKLAVALTKIDRCDKARIETVTQDIATLLQDSALATAPVFPVSNADGSGVPALTGYLQAWLDMPVVNAETDSAQYFRFLIDRSFTVKGIGTVVTGSARAGTAAVGANVLHSATRTLTRLRGLRLDQTAINSIARGQRAAANLTLAHTDINRGDWLLDPHLFHPVTRFDASLQFVADESRIVENAEYHLHIGAAHHIVTLRQLGKAEENAAENVKKNEKESEKEHQKGHRTHKAINETESAQNLKSDSTYFQIKCHESILAHFGDRFVIRDPAAQHTIAGGKVIDIYVPRRGRATPQRLAILKAMDQATPAAITALLECLPEGLDLNQFAVCRNLTSNALITHLANLQQASVAFTRLTDERNILPVILHTSTFENYANIILAYLQNYHSKHSNQQGVSEPALSREVRFEGSHRLFHGILRELLQEGKIKRTGTLLHLPTHTTSLSAEEQQFLSKVRPILLKAGKVPPRTRELVEMTGIPLKPLDRLLKETARAGTLIKVADNRYYLPETIMELAEVAERLAHKADDEESFSVIQFRDVTGIGRNLCIEILEYFDKVGFTRRDDNKRFLRTDKENIFGK